MLFPYDTHCFKQYFISVHDIYGNLVDDGNKQSPRGAFESPVAALPCTASMLPLPGSEHRELRESIND